MDDAGADGAASAGRVIGKRRCAGCGERKPRPAFAYLPERDRLDWLCTDCRGTVGAPRRYERVSRPREEAARFERAIADTRRRFGLTVDQERALRGARREQFERALTHRLRQLAIQAGDAHVA